VDAITLGRVNLDDLSITVELLDTECRCEIVLYFPMVSLTYPLAVQPRRSC
jgi:hypothetical protein